MFRYCGIISAIFCQSLNLNSAFDSAWLYISLAVQAQNMRCLFIYMRWNTVGCDYHPSPTSACGQGVRGVMVRFTKRGSGSGESDFLLFFLIAYRTEIKVSDKHPCQMDDIAAHREQKNRRNHDSATLILPFIYLRLNLKCVHTCQLRH